MLSITSQSICNQCKFRSRQAKANTGIISHEFKIFKNHELVIRLEKTQKAKRKALKQLARLSATIPRIMMEEGVCVSSDHNEFSRSVLNKEGPKLEEGTPMGLLWQQQIKQTSSNPKAMRWHCLIIRWCLSIFHV